MYKKSELPEKFSSSVIIKICHSFRMLLLKERITDIGNLEVPIWRERSKKKNTRKKEKNHKKTGLTLTIVLSCVYFVKWNSFDAGLMYAFPRTKISLSVYAQKHLRSDWASIVWLMHWLAACGTSETWAIILLGAKISEWVQACSFLRNKMPEGLTTWSCS